MKPERKRKGWSWGEGTLSLEATNTERHFKKLRKDKDSLDKHWNKIKIDTNSPLFVVLE